jgi:diguanylate cyclase (GGDEF)-like protein
VRHRRPSISIGLAFAAAAFGLYAGVILVTDPGDPLNELATRWVYTGLFVVSFLIVAARALVVPTERLAWSVVALSLASWSFAEIYFAAAAPAEYPSLADVGWLGFYPLAYVGIVLLVRPRARTLAGTLWLDGVTASVAAAALGAAVLLEVVLRAAEGSAAAVATNLAYPLGDMLLLSAVCGVLSLAGWRVERRWLVLGLGVLATTVADAIYLFELETYQEGSAIDILWPAATLAIAGAAWVGARGERELRVEGRPLLAVPAVCSLTALGILLFDHFGRVNLLAVGLAVATLLFVLLRLVFTFRENSRLYAMTRHESVTDPLTGLGNRRKLLADLDALLAAEEPPPTLLMLFDLNGFKGYNDRFGHPAGDALLARLGEKLAAVTETGGSYRLGGDEFCVVAPVTPSDVEPLIDRACAALSERGEGFDVSTSFGGVMLTDEASDAREALSLADERLYAQKHFGRRDADPTTYAFLEALAVGRDLTQPEGGVDLTVAVGTRLGLREGELVELARAARLHNLGKLAVPEEILDKPGPLDEQEWDFIRRHPVVGERILRASPAFRSVAAIVRASHENVDGSGYPDGLVGDDIPLAARIVRVCDAFEAMTSARPYRAALTVEEALAELERGSGSAFDPEVAATVTACVRDRVEADRAA